VPNRLLPMGERVAYCDKIAVFLRQHLQLCLVNLFYSVKQMLSHGDNDVVFDDDDTVIVSLLLLCSLVR